MLQYLTTFFPDYVDKIRKLSISKKILTVSLLVSLPFILAYRKFIHQLLLSSVSINGYSILMLFIIVLALINLKKKSKRKLLVSFVKEWVTFSKNFEMIYFLTDIWLHRGEEKKDDLWDKMVPYLEKHWPAREKLRELLFLLGENNLLVYENKHWLQLKKEEQLFLERDYNSPFSFLLDLGNPIAEINYHGKAINWSMTIAKEFLEHLMYKYPYLKKFSQEN